MVLVRLLIERGCPVAITIRPTCRSSDDSESLLVGPPFRPATPPNLWSDGRISCEAPGSRSVATCSSRVTFGDVGRLVSLSSPLFPSGAADHLQPSFSAATRHTGQLAMPSLAQEASRYTRAAVSWNRAARSVGEKCLVIRLKAFHRTSYENDALSTGKLLSNMHRFGPNSSIQKR